MDKIKLIGKWTRPLAGTLGLLGLACPAFAQKPGLGEVCERLAVYNEAGANFVSGVDVNGNAVVPADLDGGEAAGIYDPVIIPVSIDLNARYGQNAANAELKPEVAWIEIYRDGRILFNGEDIGPDIRATCPLDNPGPFPEQDGQSPADPLVSGDNNTQKGTNGGE